MSNRSSCAVLLLAITLVVAPGVSRSPAGAQGPERDPFAEEPSAEVKPEKPKVEDPFGPSASKADAQAGPTTAEVRAPAKARPKRRKGKAAATPKLPLRYGEKAVIEALAEPTEMEFIETPLDDVLAHLQNKHRIHVRRDRKALDDVGIGTDTPITISLSGVPLDVALKTMLRDLDLTFTVRDGMLLVTTLEEEETTLLTRTYDVTDLVLPIGDKRYDSRRLPTVARKTSNDWAQVPYYSMGIGGGTSGKAGAMGGSGGTGGNFFNVMGAPYPGTPYPSANASPDFDSLIDAITSTIAPDSWDEVGGPGSIAPLGTSFVIAQRWDVHRRIEALLEELRARQRGVPTVAIDARWLLLDSEGLDRVLADGPGVAGRVVADAKMLDHLTRTVPGARARIACLNGTATYVVAGDRRSQITSAIPVVGSGIGYQPVISIPNVGVLLQVRPVVDHGADTAMLHLASTVTRWRDQPAPVAVGGQNPPAEVEEFGNESERTHVPAGSAQATVDRPRIAAQEVASSLRVPLGRPVLIGGLTLDPTEKTAAERKQLYLFVETSLVGWDKLIVAGGHNQR